MTLFHGLGCRVRWRRIVAALALLGLVGLSPASLASDHHPRARASEAQVKSVVLTKVLLFTDLELLRGRDRVLDIYILGESALGEHLELALGELRSAHGEVRVEAIDDLDDMEDAGVLVVGSEHGAAPCELVRRGRELGLLTVSDRSATTSEGVMVGLGLEDKRVTLWINNGEVKRAGVHLNSRLLRLARLVETSQECR